MGEKEEVQKQLEMNAQQSPTKKEFRGLEKEIVRTQQ
jgi:hypothetical protein